MKRFIVSGEKLEFDGEHMMWKESVELQKATGLTPSEFGQGCRNGDALAIGAMVWLAKRRAGTLVPFDEFDFDFADFEVLPDDEPASPPNASDDPEGVPNP